MIKKAQAIEAINNGAQLTFDTIYRQASILFEDGTSEVIRYDVAERLAAQLEDLERTDNGDWYAYRAYAKRLTAEQSEAVALGLTRSEALTGGGAFGLVACIDSVSTYIEVFGETVPKLYAEFTERAEHEWGFNKRMITALERYAERRGLALVEEEPTAEELEAREAFEELRGRIEAAEEADELAELWAEIEAAHFTVDGMGEVLRRIWREQANIHTCNIFLTYYNRISLASDEEDAHGYYDTYRRTFASLNDFEANNISLRFALSDRLEELKTERLPQTFAEAMETMGDLFADGGDFSTRFRFWDELGGYAWEFMTERNNDPDRAPMNDDILTEYISTLDPLDAFRMGYFTADGFSWNDDIFNFNGYGNLQSFSSWHSYFREEVDGDDFAEWFAEEYEAEALELLEEYADELGK